MHQVQTVAGYVRSEPDEFTVVLSGMGGQVLREPSVLRAFAPAPAPAPMTR